MQIAALEGDPAAAELVGNLRRVLRPRKIEFILADRGVAFTTGMPKEEFSTAAAQIAARRKDFDKGAALARLPRRDVLIDPPGIVFDAFLQESDWRAAAEIAKQHDPRKTRPIEGLDDDRASQYVELHKHLAVMAAWSGDDAAAATFLRKAMDVHRAELREHDELTTEERLGLVEPWLVGAAEGLLPRKYLHVLLPAFRHWV